MNKISFDLSLVPKEWLIFRCGNFFSEQNIKNTKGEKNLSVYRDYGVIPTDSRDDNHNRISEDISNYKLVEPGNLVLNKMKGWQGSLGISEHRGIVSPSYTVMKPIRNINNKYFHYLLRSEIYRQIYESLSHGVRIGQWELRYHDFKTIPALYPTLKEQNIISKYLDKKTEQIDFLINKILKKINLLKEQRISLVRQYVTKGLDTKVIMKDSNVKWIEKIPSHWTISKFKYQFRFGMGETILKEFLTDTGIPVLSATEHYKILGFYDHPKLILEKDDLVIPARGNSIGFVKIVKEKSVSTQTTIYAKKIKNINSGFVKYFCEGYKFFLFQFDRTAIPQITVDQVENNTILVPPFEEQTNISEKLNLICTKSEKLIEQYNNKIELLKTYRQSLISSIVIGMIRIKEEI